MGDLGGSEGILGVSRFIFRGNLWEFQESYGFYKAFVGFQGSFRVLLGVLKGLFRAFKEVFEEVWGLFVGLFLGGFKRNLGLSY